MNSNMPTHTVTHKYEFNLDQLKYVLCKELGLKFEKVSINVDYAVISSTYGDEPATRVPKIVITTHGDADVK